MGQSREVVAPILPTLASIALTVSLCAGCTSPVHHAGAAANSGLLAGQARVSCPPPAPVSAGSVPRSLRPSYPGNRWYGSRGLWIVWPGMERQFLTGRKPGGYGLKWGSVTLDSRGRVPSWPNGGMLAPGPPRLEARRVDGPGSAQGSIGGYATAGAGRYRLSFWPTVIDFPTRGCWLLTETLRATTIRFLEQVP